MSNSCNDYGNFQVNKELFKDWKNDSINEFKSCCDSKNKEEHFMDEINNLLHFRTTLFSKLISEVDISNENKFIIIESIQSKGVIGGRWMKLETPIKIYQAHLLENGISITIFDKEIDTIKIPKESKCCSQELQEYEKYSGFINFKYYTVFARQGNNYKRRVYIEN